MKTALARLAGPVFLPRHMRHKASLVFTLTAWLLATGSHWDLVQTFAWGRMIADYARAMPLTEAVSKTFSPQTMCPLCHVVAEAKQQESRNTTVPDAKSPSKIVLVYASAPLTSAPRIPTVLGELDLAARWESNDRAAPVSPPPRGLI